MPFILSSFNPIIQGFGGFGGFPFGDFFKDFEPAQNVIDCLVNEWNNINDTNICLNLFRFEDDFNEQQLSLIKNFTIKMKGIKIL